MRILQQSSEEAVQREGTRESPQASAMEQMKRPTDASPTVRSSVSNDPRGYGSHRGAAHRAQRLLHDVRGRHPEATGCERWRGGTGQS